MKKIRLSDRLGVKILDLDVRTMSGADMDEILSDLDRYGILCFPGQLLSDDDLLVFSRSVGALEEPARKIAHSPTSHHVGYLTNLRRESGESLGFGGRDTDFWHSDQEYREHPATLATLYCLVPASVGGTTSFASTAVQWLGLSEEERKTLGQLEVTYVAPSTHDNVEHVEVVHPVLLESPVLGRQSLYVSENAKRFIGLGDAEGRALKRDLLQRILTQENIYSHAWTMGDLLLYDNTQLLHRRDAFEGMRWMKATKIFAPIERFAVPYGRVLASKVA